MLVVDSSPAPIEPDPVQIGVRTGSAEIFSFGDPEPVMSRRDVMDLCECYHNGRWWEPPIPLEGLARVFRSSPHHGSAIQLKVRLLSSSFKPSKWLSRQAFAAAAQDYLVFGNAYLERRTNRLGGLLRLDHALAKYTRRGLADGDYWFVTGYKKEEQFAPGSIVQVRAPDINQEIYGVPDYLSALQSALLNEAATLFRRRYYENGSHAGYILYATGDFGDGDIEAIKESLRQSKGPGNFRNMFVHTPSGKESGLKIIPVTEVGAKDEFLGIKNVTRDDVLAAHRTPPQLLGIVPTNAGGFGDVSVALDAFKRSEILALQNALLDINDQLGVEAIMFEPMTEALPKK
jgi:PBSX family phage portal protein